MPVRPYQILRDNLWVEVPRSWRNQFIVDLTTARPELTLARIGADFIRPSMTSQGVSLILRRVRPAGAAVAAAWKPDRKRGRVAATVLYAPHDIGVLDHLRRRAHERALSLTDLAALTGIDRTRIRTLMLTQSTQMWISGVRTSFRDVGLLSDCLTATGHRYELYDQQGWKPETPVSDGTLYALLLDQLAEDSLSDQRLARLIQSDPFAVRRLLRAAPGTLVEVFECDQLAVAMGAGWVVRELVTRTPDMPTIHDLPPA